MLDDDDLVRRVVARTLRARGYDLVDVVDVESALGLVRSGDRFDMLLIDLHLPNGTGDVRFLVSELALIAPGQLERVVYYTGGPRNEEERQLLAGARVLLKPGSFDQIETLLKVFVATRAA